MWAIVTGQLNVRPCFASTAAPLGRATYTVGMSANDQFLQRDARALAGWNVLVTRPRDSAEALVRGLRLHGAHVLRLPAQQVQSNPEFDWPAALAGCAGVDDWVFTSPAATLHVQPLLERGLPDGHVFAVGAGTARALLGHGITAIAPVRQHNSESLLEQPGMIDVKSRRVAIITAPGGRDVIATTLRERGADVVEWHVYRRKPVDWSKRQLAALAAADDPLLTILSSSEALDIFVTSLPTALWQRLRDARWIASSSRLEQALRQHGATSIDLAASALASDLIRAALILS